MLVQSHLLTYHDMKIFGKIDRIFAIFPRFPFNIYFAEPVDTTNVRSAYKLLVIPQYNQKRGCYNERF